MRKHRIRCPCCGEPGIRALVKHWLHGCPGIYKDCDTVEYGIVYDRKGGDKQDAG